MASKHDNWLGLIVLLTCVAAPLAALTGVLVAVWCLGVLPPEAVPTLIDGAMFGQLVALAVDAVAVALVLRFR